MRILLVCLAFLCVTALPVWGQAPVSGQVDSLLTAYAEKELFSGTVLVAADGQVYRNGYGIANRSWNIPNEANTRFQIASLTKPFTSMLVLQLVERGTLSLKDPISMYLPEYPGEYGADVTLNHLLTHTSGIPNYTERSVWPDTTSRIEVRPADFANTIAQRPLDFKPGTDFSYSNSNYYLLGVIVETTTGMSYSRVLEQQILKPARLQNTGYLFSRMIVDSLAKGYERLYDGFYEEAPYQSPATSYAAGGLFSNVSDLYRWEQLLYADRLLTEDFRTRMMTPQTSNYALGWVVGEAYSDEVSDFFSAPFSFESSQRENGERYRLVWHWGSNPGFNALLVRVPDQRWTIVILENQQLANDPEGSNIFDIAGEIFEFLHNSQQQ